MWIISLVSLSTVTALCSLGVFHPAFKDNLIQRIGMGWLVIACCGRVYWIWLNETTNASWMLVHAGMAIYAIGTAFTTTINHGRTRGWLWLARLDVWLLRHSTRGAFDDKPHHWTRS